jgi:periplasmic protein CpxP/Spy
MQTTTTRKLIAAGLVTTLTSFGVLGFAQSSSAPSPELHAQHMAQRADRVAISPAEQQAKHQQRHAERQAALKATLGITAEQEPAWNAFVARTAPEARPHRRADREDWEKLTTPERLDKMQAHQAERAASMTARIDATRSFYSALTPEQQQRFDAQAQPHLQRAGMHGKHRHGGHGTNAPRS